MIDSYKILTELKPPRKFQHKFILDRRAEDISNQEVLKWIKENCGKYNKDYLYWGLIKENPWASGPEIYFKTADLAMAFKLRWT